MWRCGWRSETGRKCINGGDPKVKLEQSYCDETTVRCLPHHPFYAERNSRFLAKKKSGQWQCGRLVRPEKSEALPMPVEYADDNARYWRLARPSHCHYHGDSPNPRQKKRGRSGGSRRGIPRGRPKEANLNTTQTVQILGRQKGAAAVAAAVRGE